MTSENLIAPLARRRRSSLFRLAAIAFLIALLHIPQGLTHGVLRERQTYQAQATAEISRLWGGAQSVTGPVLQVPYVYRGTVRRSRQVNGQWVQVDEPEPQEAFAYFVPERLRVEGNIRPEVRKRGIYEATVYTADLKFSGTWKPDFAAAGIEAERINWGKARVLFGVSDLHGLRTIAWMQPQGASGPLPAFETVDGTPGALLPLGAPVRADATEPPADFAFEVVVQGTDAVKIAPVGKQTSVALQSPWTEPSFIGASLPVSRSVEANGFSAEWADSHFSRGFPDNWVSPQMKSADILRRIDAAAFGVRFGHGVDGYGMVERAQKYGVLFFVLVFAVFFLFEVTAGLQIHPLQYAMVGAALCLFFLGFLALTEFWSTGLAYAVAAAACTAMVGLYSWSFLQSGSRTGIVLAGLSVTYGYLYFVLQSQDFALIAGTVALFVALGLTMYFTRRVNWYALDRGDNRVGA